MECIKRPSVNHRTGYKIDGCRCGDCCEADRIYMTAYVATEDGYAKVKAARERIRAKRKLWIRNYKSERGCADCGWNSHPVALQFDHLDGKEFNISTNLNLAWDRILAEIAKCDVGCANCHHLRTYRRANGWVLLFPDGTVRP